MHTQSQTYSQATFHAMIAGVLRAQCEYAPFRVSVPEPEIESLSVSGTDADSFCGYARFRVVDGLSFSLSVERDGDWLVTVNPSIRLGDLTPTCADHYAAAFAVAARVARMTEAMLRADAPRRS